MQIGPRQAKNFKILRDRGKGGIEVGARSAELDGGGGAMAADAAVAELHSYLEESLQGYLALDIVSFCAYCPCRSIQIVDGRMPPISGTDSLCQISGETARFGDEALGRQGLAQHLYPRADRIGANKLIFKKVPAPVGIIFNACDHAGNNDFREIFKLQKQSVKVSGVVRFTVKRYPLVDSVEQWLPCHVSCPL